MPKKQQIRKYSLRHKEGTPSKPDQTTEEKVSEPLIINLDKYPASRGFSVNARRNIYVLQPEVRFLTTCQQQCEIFAGSVNFDISFLHN